MSFDATRLVWQRLEDPELRLSSPARFVLVALADHVNDATKLCNPGRMKIARRTGYGRATVSRAIVELVAGGHVQIVASGGGGTSNRYQLTVLTVSTAQTEHGSQTAGGVLRESRDRAHSEHLTKKEPRSNQPPPALSPKGERRTCLDCTREMPDERRLKSRCADCQLAVDSQTEARKASA